jgi:hypothetical protein
LRLTDASALDPQSKPLAAFVRRSGLHRGGHAPQFRARRGRHDLFVARIGRTVLGVGRIVEQGSSEVRLVVLRQGSPSRFVRLALVFERSRAAVQPAAQGRKVCSLEKFHVQPPMVWLAVDALRVYVDASPRRRACSRAAASLAAADVSAASFMGSAGVSAAGTLYPELIRTSSRDFCLIFDQKKICVYFGSNTQCGGPFWLVIIKLL